MACRPPLAGLRAIRAYTPAIVRVFPSRRPVARPCVSRCELLLAARVAALVRICATLVVGGWYFVIAEMLEQKEAWDSDPMAARAVSVFAALLILLVVLLWAAAAALAACVARRACLDRARSDSAPPLCTGAASDAPAATEMVASDKDDELSGLDPGPADGTA